MKQVNLLTTLLAGLLVVFFSTVVLAQDPVQAQEKEQTQEQVKSAQQSGNTYQNKIQHGKAFQDKNGDGVNDNAPDHDGDGIPNGQDSDYDGAKNRAGNGKKGFVDENGDGINDNAEDWDNDGIPNGKDEDFTRPQDGSGAQHRYGKQSRNKSGQGSFGPGDGTGNSGIGPKDGSGNGPASGECDGTGPKGSAKGKGKS
jgi:hypothetical protein